MINKKYSLRYRKDEKERKSSGGKLLILLLLFICFGIVISKFLTTDLYSKIKYQTCYASLKNLSPVLMKDKSFFTTTLSKKYYDIRMESDLEYEIFIAEEDVQESQTGTQAAVVQENEAAAQENVKQENAQQIKTNAIALDKLKDFDYLIQNFYTVDKMTTITSKKLDAEELLSIDCTMEKKASKPQILIYHTHSQEGYKDSEAGDASQTVVGVGDYLTKLLTEKYGYSVIHHKGTYDLEDRNNAYTNVAPAIEKILSEYPSVEVVIDLHRDGVPDTTHLVTEIDGKPTAKIMFFNGLSYSTAVGDIDYLYNPYIKENLAFSFQLQLQSVEKFPGLSRKIYLKGYRYNLHFKPKSLLVEVGAQTNTLAEAMNAMEPFAEILDSVLSGD